MRKKAKVIPVYYCPFCAQSYKHNIGKMKLDTHVQTYHPDKVAEYQKMPRDQLFTSESVEVLEGRGHAPLASPSTQIQQPQSEQPQVAEQPTTVEVQQPLQSRQQLQQTKQQQQPQQTPQAPLVVVQAAPQPQQQQPQQPSQQPQAQQPQQPQQPQPQQQQPPQELQQQYYPLPEIIDTYEPHMFLQAFLEHYHCKPNFVHIQVDMVRTSGERLPEVQTLVNDLKTMDSGHQKSGAMPERVGHIYEIRLRKYWQKQAEMKQPRRTLGMPGQQNPYQQPGQVKGYYYDQQPQQYPYPQYPQGPVNPLEAKVTELANELKRRDAERMTLLQNKLEEMERKQEARREVDPQMLQIQQQMKDLTDENKRLAQDKITYEKQSTDEKINQLLQMQQSQITPEQIQMLINKGIITERDRFTGTDLKQYVDAELHKLETQRGTTQMDVELKKAEHEVEIEKAKISAEEKKTETWGENLKSVADVAAEALGRGLSTVSGPQPTAQQPGPGGMPPPGNQILCPSCRTQLQLPIGVTDASCGKCRAQFTMGADGIPQLIGQRMQPIPLPTEEQTPPTTQAGFTVETDAEAAGPDKLPEDVHVQHTEEPPTAPSQVVREPPEQEFKPTGREHNVPTKKEPQDQPPEPPLGNCPKCGRPVYDNNIGKTEKGQPYHKECV